MRNGRSFGGVHYTLNSKSQFEQPETTISMSRDHQVINSTAILGASENFGGSKKLDKKTKRKSKKNSGSTNTNSIFQDQEDTLALLK
jgi:hypothetical protein